MIPGWFVNTHSHTLAHVLISEHGLHGNTKQMALFSKEVGLKNWQSSAPQAHLRRPCVCPQEVCVCVCAELCFLCWLWSSGLLLWEHSGLTVSGKARWCQVTVTGRVSCLKPPILEIAQSFTKCNQLSTLYYFIQNQECFLQDLFYILNPFQTFKIWILDFILALILERVLLFFLDQKSKT